MFNLTYSIDRVQTSKICDFRLLRKRWGFTHRSEGGTWQGSSSSGSRHLHSLTDHDPNVWTQKVRWFLKGKNQLETKSSHKSVPRTQPLAESVAEIAPAEGAHPMQHLGRPCATHPTHGSKLFDLRKMKLEIPCKNSKHEFLITVMTYYIHKVLVHSWAPQMVWSTHTSAPVSDHKVFRHLSCKKMIHVFPPMLAERNRSACLVHKWAFI